MDIYSRNKQPLRKIKLKGLIYFTSSLEKNSAIPCFFFLLCLCESLAPLAPAPPTTSELPLPLSSSPSPTKHTWPFLLPCVGNTTSRLPSGALFLRPSRCQHGRRLPPAPPPSHGPTPPARPPTTPALISSSC